MTALLMSSAIWLIIAIAVAFKANSRDAGLHRKAKVVSFLCVAFIVLFHCTAFRMLGWAFGHPEKILSTVYVAHDLFPPWASISVWALFTIFSVAALVLGFGLARRKNRSRVIFLRLLPLVALVDWLETFKGAMAQPRTTGTYLMLGALTGLLIIVPYALIAFFYTRKSVEEAIFSEGKTEPNVRANGGVAPCRGSS